jgi:autotransporter strand-loop-strand O-heptosyltransferase
MDFKLYNIDGLYFELVDSYDDKEYQCAFIEERNGVRTEIYKDNLKKGMWMKCNKRYIGNFFVEIRNDKGVLKERISFLHHLKGKRVFISFDSAALGDTIAWMPYTLEFQQHYQCEVIVSTFKNWMFKDVYPELEFVEPGSTVENIIAMPQLGWFWNKDKEPVNPVTIPLQKTACNILHLPYKEQRPRIINLPGVLLENDKYVCISTKSTSQCKLWDKWSELVQALKDQGYRVIELSKDADDYGAEMLENTSLESVINHLNGCEFYIGLSSGISWLAWALEVKVVMIANFTEANHEFDCIRIDNRNVCNGCWNNPKFRFNRGDWNWCPEHEDTPRQHECHKSISVQDVLSKCISSHPNN